MLSAMLCSSLPHNRRAHWLILCSEESADHRKLALPVLPGTLQDPLCSPVVDA